MLELIRKNVRHPYIKALLGLVIVVFIFFFGWSMKSQKPMYVAKVNGDTIEYRTYQRTYNGLVNVYQEALKENFTPERARELDLGRRAADQLIEQTLLLQEANDRDLEVNNTELQAAIQAAPTFQQDGVFNKQRYLQLLETSRLTPLEYETLKRQELLLSRAEQAIRAEAAVSDEEVEQEFRDRNTEIAIEYAAFRPTAYELEVTIDEEALADYFAAEGESFRLPEQRTARYLLLAPEQYLDAVEVGEQEIEDEFRWRASEFAVKEAVSARHILFRLAPDASAEDEDQVLQQAQTVYQQLLDGADFAALARTHSADPGSKDNGGDLGWFERGAMVPEFEAAAFSLEPGVVSEPVKSAFGYHLILVEERREAEAGDLEQAREQLTADLSRRKALETAYSAADNLLMDLEDAITSWDELAETEGYRTSPPVSRDGAVAGIENSAEFVSVLFGLAPEAAGQLLETTAGTYLIAVAEVEPSAIPELDAVRDAVTASFRRIEAQRMAADRAEQLLSAATEQGWDAAVASLGVTVEQTELFGKKGGAVPKLGWAPDLKEAAFALGESGSVVPEVYAVGGAEYVVRVTERVEADLTGLDAERETLRAEILPRKQNDHYTQYVKQLRERADVVINEDVLL